MTTPVELRVTRWKCPHCSKSYSKRPAAQAHVDRCWMNPGARSCKTCVNRIEPGSEYGWVTDEGCRAGVELPMLDRVPMAVTLPVNCPKWEPTMSRVCRSDDHEKCPRFDFYGMCYCPCHGEEQAA